MNFFGTSAQVIPVLYLAVILQVFASAPTAARDTPFGLGLRWGSTPAESYRRSWYGMKTALLIVGVQVAAVAGVVLALTETSEALVAACLAYQATLLVGWQTFWAFLAVAEQHRRRHGATTNAFERHSVRALNVLFGAPLAGAIMTGLLVQSC